MTFLPSALPWRGLLFFPALLVFVGVLLFSTATFAFYVKQTLTFARLRVVFDRRPGVQGSAAAALLGAATPFCTCTALSLPEIVVLSRVLQPRVVVSFVGATLALYSVLGLGFIWL